MEKVYLETIRYRDGSFFNVDYHKQRVLSTIGQVDVWSEIYNLLNILPLRHLKGDVKCSIEYCASRGVVAWRVSEYRPKAILKLVPMESDVEYSYKYANREKLLSLKKGLGDNEEPLIIKNGLVTDTTFSNVVFKCVDGTLVTPKKPLLYGTKRAQLLRQGLIVEQDIRVSQLFEFVDFYLINSMRDI